MHFIISTLLLFSFFVAPIKAASFQAVQIYSDNQLLDLIKENKHLSQVVLDDCQLVQDIEARATKTKQPSYQFLWGDMLAFGVCIKKDIKLGLYYMKLSADQGLPEGLEQLGRYYHIGKFMQVDIDKAVMFLKEAAILNNLKAQLRLAEIYDAGYGSPLDFPELYSLLHHAITDDKKTYRTIAMRLAQLAEKMPDHIVAKAKRTTY